MARTRTLTQLRTDVADRADIEVPGASTFVTSTTMNRWINQSIRRFIGRLVEAYGEDYYSKTSTISVVADTAAYALPSDFFRQVYFRVTIEGTRVKIERASLDAIDMDQPENIGWSACVPGYRLLGNQVVFTPTPKASHTVTLRYVGTAVLFDNGGSALSDLSADTDYLDGINGWEEWVVLDCARKALIKQERDPSAVIAEMREIEAEIDSLKSERAADGATVRETYPEEWL